MRMISWLKGKIIDSEEKSLILNVNGIGYKIFGTFETLNKNGAGEEVSFWIHHSVREDSEDLYGFTSKEDLKFFEMLIGISGIGPKTALGILNVATASALKKAISSGDTSHLTKVSGIGKKNAEKIVLELRDKFEEDENNGINLREEVDTLEALKALGYSHKDARDALKDIPESITKTEQRIKEALKKLSH